MSVIRVVAAIFIQDGKVLACRRSPHKASGGLWEFPGGKIEPGEDPKSALAREILEELGVHIEVGEHFNTSVTDTAQGAIQLECYIVESAEPPGQSTDHDQMAWVSRKELHALDWAKPDLPAVSRLSK